MTSLDELNDMLHLLVDDLAIVGPEIYEGKTKLLSHDYTNPLAFVDIKDKLIEVPPIDKYYKSLGKHFIACPSRAQCEIQHRIQYA